MTLYPKILGYLGALPFVVIAFALIVFHDDTVRTSFFAVLQLCYASMILSFLGGVHWPYAVAGRDNLRLTLSMIPTIICAALLYIGFSFNPFYPLLGVASLFWFVFALDKKYYDMLVLPDGYLSYRRTLTMIVSGLLVLSYCLAI